MEAIERLLIFLPGLLLGFALHEFAHAWVAVRQGDDTPLRDGRVTLDPRAHLDPVGSLLFPAIAAVSGFPIIGWARPVITQPSRYRHYKRGSILVAIAGVTANLLLAVGLGLLAAVLAPAFATGQEGGVLGTVGLMCLAAVQVNVALIVFNLLPIPPLDGANLLLQLLPPGPAAQFRALYPYGFIILYALAFTGGLRFLVPAVVLGIRLFFEVPAALLHG